ncbi:MAG: ABC-F family ATP-binding cassette domain-containing protein [Alphaproteobacteria bacterium]
MLTIDDFSCRIAGRLIIDHASAFIPAGHKVGLVGRNGSGKTTLFKAIQGQLDSESGRISLPRGLRIGGVAQEAPASSTSLLDVVLAADTERAALLAERDTTNDPHRIAEIETRLFDIQAQAAPARAAAILAGLGFGADDIVRPCSDFSGGWRMRVALAAVLFAEPDLLLLDEPTNYLDLEGALWLEDYLARYPHTVLLISHDRDLLNRAVDAILHLEHGKLTLYTGGFDRFQQQRAMKLDLLKAAKSKQDAQAKHLQAFVDRFKAKASKARQAQSRVKALEKMQAIVIPESERVAPIVFPETEKMSPPVLVFENVSAGYGDHVVLSKLTLRIDPDDRIALLGKNGNGKSTFAKLISQRLKAMGGSVVRSPKLRVGYFAQHQVDELDMDGTPFSHMQKKMPDQVESKVRARCGFFGFGADKVMTKIAKLSGGEKARLLLALAAFDAPHIMVLDEPTNHLDIEARAALIEAIASYDGAVILVSHDRHLIETSADQLWLVSDGRVAPFEGDMDDYEDYVLGRKGKPGSAAQSQAAAASEKQSKADQRKANAGKRSELAPLKKKSDAAEKEVARLAAEIAKIETALADPKLYKAEPFKLLDATKQRGELKKKLAEAETIWMEALETYEEAQRETA